MSLEKKDANEIVDKKQEQEKKDQKLLEKPEQVDAGAKQLATEAAEAAKKGSQVSPESKKDIDQASSKFHEALKNINPNLKPDERLKAIQKEYDAFQSEIEKIVGTTEGSEAKQNKDFMEKSEESQKKQNEQSTDFAQKLLKSLRETQEKTAQEKIKNTEQKAKEASELKEQEAKKSSGEAKGEVLSNWPA